MTFCPDPVSGTDASPPLLLPTALWAVSSRVHCFFIGFSKGWAEKGVQICLTGSAICDKMHAVFNLIR
jgi:hypothetical protein